MEITVLNENYCDKQGFIAEHGLSLFVKTRDHRFLFDTGQNISVKNNVNLLFNGNFTVDFTIISHGHYDHAGGLEKETDFFKKLSSKIYASKYVFDKHFRKTTYNHFDFIGVNPKVKNDFEFIFLEKELQISENIFLAGQIEQFENFDADHKLYYKAGNRYIKDNFRDEIYLLYKEKDLNVLITGCSHSGIINILLDCQKRFDVNSIDFLIGGLHLFRSDKKYLDRITSFFNNEFEVKNIITGHCTGLLPFFHLKQNLKKTNVEYMKTGTTFKILENT